MKNSNLKFKSLKYFVLIASSMLTSYNVKAVETKGAEERVQGKHGSCDIININLSTITNCALKVDGQNSDDVGGSLMRFMGQNPQEEDHVPVNIGSIRGKRRLMGEICFACTKIIFTAIQKWKVDPKFK